MVANFNQYIHTSIEVTALNKKNEMLKLENLKKKNVINLKLIIEKHKHAISKNIAFIRRKKN